MDFGMDFATWAAFAAASTALLLIPGPTVLLVVSYAMGRGWRVAAPMAVGVALGDLVAMTAAMLGVGALLAASATLFMAVKWIGAAWLAWLGLKLWRAGGATPVEARADAAPPERMLGHAFLVTVLNPKSILFFVAFAPQFVDPARAFAPQMTTLTATFVTLAFVNALGYALAGARAGRLARSPRAMRLVNRIGGGALMAAGAAMALTRRAA
ncbi:LysE family translocator [Rubrimonas cliftonensis]|uniref:Threonine/homoserine/homoserine lactone efflux protein n=1 Tax=Rubrimonas cliftonensis TaxID=89524 RepID=A0A1H3YYK0_9RHOB|nr:LysE family translocator [Rubrimonas cliftonensis]SEA16142.1 Threonine/homoserine/homoserine lactone efflux protein [Rubrimonas cliftonensis]